jgi:hypothetical protein
VSQSVEQRVLEQFTKAHSENPGLWPTSLWDYIQPLLRLAQVANAQALSPPTPGSPVAVVMPEALEACRLRIAQCLRYTLKYNTGVDEDVEDFFDGAERVLGDVALVLFPGGVEFAEAVGPVCVSDDEDVPSPVIYDPATMTSIHRLRDGDRIAVLKEVEK